MARKPRALARTAVQNQLCAGVDIGKADVKVCLRVPGPGTRRRNNRLRAQLLEYFPALQRAFDCSTSKAALILLSGETEL